LAQLVVLLINVENGGDIILKKIAIIFFALILSGCAESISDDGLYFEVKSEEHDNKEYINENSLNITIEQAKGEFYQSEDVENLVNIENNTERNIRVYIQSEMIDSSGKICASNLEIFDISTSETKVVQARIALEDEIATGRYKTKITVWDGDPEIKETKVIKQSISEQEILYFRNKDDFILFDENIWGISNKQLGKTYFKSENVYVQDGYLKISLTQNKLEGGEIYTVKKYGYGIYEIRMKLPLAQSSITGFFMYSPPDYFYEIDMEFFNDSSGTLLLTTYSEGNIRNEEKHMLDFDATKDFHDYRFEYSEDNIKFYVDNQFILQYTEGVPKDEMQLMVNCWYPKWLGLTPALEKEELLIDWIKY